MPYCTLNCISFFGQQDKLKTCAYVTANCEQESIQMIRTYYCQLNQSFILLIILGIPVGLLLLKTLSKLAGDFLTPTVEQFIKDFNISPTLAGVTILAFANGAPDVVTAIVAASNGSEEGALLPFGSIFGASLFSMAFILSVVIKLSPKKVLKLSRRDVLVPLGFYIVSMLYLIFISVFFGYMTYILGSVLLVFYCIYIIFVLKRDSDMKKLSAQMTPPCDEGLEMSPNRKNQVSSPEGTMNSAEIAVQIREGYDSTEHPTKPGQATLTVKTDSTQKLSDNKKVHFPHDVSDKVAIGDDKDGSGSKLAGKPTLLTQLDNKIDDVLERLLCYIIPPISIETWNPSRALLSVGLIPFTILFTQGRATVTTLVAGIPLIVLLSVIPIILFIVTLYYAIKGEAPSSMKVYTIVSFFLTVMLVAYVCGVLVNLLELFRLLTGINPVFLGLTVMAWANTLGDYKTITTFAKHGHAATAVSAIFSAQLFNFLIGFGVSLVVHSLQGPYKFAIFQIPQRLFDILSDSIVIVVISAGLIYFITLFCMVTVSNGRLTLKHSKFCYGYYLAFLGFGFVIAIASDFYRNFECEDTT